MNEIALSDDLNVITAEINSYKQVAGQAIFEIGKRLKHVKENDLVHGEFSGWVESIGLDIREAQRFMKVADELPNTDTWSHLSNRALYLIATMPEQEREQQHEIPSTGETKTPDEMTVKELREVKKQLKQEQQARERAEQNTEKLGQLLTEERNKEPKTIEKTVIPKEFEQELEKHKRNLSWAQREINRLEEENQNARLKSDEFDEQEAERINRKLRFESERNTLEMKVHVDNFLKNASINAFRKGAIASADEQTKQKLKESVVSLKEFTKEIETALEGRIEINN